MLPHFNFEISAKNPLKGISQVVKVLHPEWDPDKLVLTILTDGLVNTILRCHVKDRHSTEAVVFRIFRKDMDKYTNRQTEITFNHMFNQYGFASKVLATFVNGFCYQYFHGKTVDLSLVRQKRVLTSIAHAMAVIHSINTSVDSPKTSKLFSTLYSYVDTLPNDLSDSTRNAKYKSFFKTKEHLRNELSILETHLSHINSPIVLCHGDPRLANILWDDGKIRFIDFEYADYNYQAYDIAAHFFSFAGLDSDPDFNSCPDENYQLQWLSKYLHTYNNRIEKRDSEQSVPKLFIQVQKFGLATHLMMAISGILGYCLSTIDMFDYGMKRLEEYFKHRDRIFSLSC